MRAVKGSTCYGLAVVAQERCRWIWLAAPRTVARFLREKAHALRVAALRYETAYIVAMLLEAAAVYERQADCIEEQLSLKI